MKEYPLIVWFRQDLRIEDHPALLTAVHQNKPVIPLFIWSPAEERDWKLGGASRWWLHGSLQSLKSELQEIGLNLIIRESPTSLQTLLDVARKTNAEGVYWNRRYEPHAIQRDSIIKAELQKQGIKAQSFNGSLLFEPWTILNKQNKPFQVFTPFWKHCCSLGEPPRPLGKPTKAIGFQEDSDSATIDSLGLLPKVHWEEGLKEFWQPGEKGAKTRLKRTIGEIVNRYVELRDFPAVRGTSELSPYLHYGELSPRMVWYAIKEAWGNGEGAEAYLRQLGWREFAFHLLYHFPHTPSQPLRPSFASFPWKEDKNALHAWQKGLTGYPIVDAGMRQLWHIGWMHNRVRMIVGSFLVKDLLIRWQEGAAWFWDTLVDADLANNTLGWQWVGGCGADAAPYFRVFNPVTQGEKFDGEGIYVKKWIPEISLLPAKWIHKPWEAPDEELKKAGIILGETYPKPIVDHAEARQEALKAFEKIKSSI